MEKNLLNDLSELVQASVISQQTADKIQDYYQFKKQAAPNRLMIVFGLLGALLIGLGIILIIAHNWDDFSRTTKSFFAFFLLLATQIIAGFTLWKKQESVSWRESSSVFLVLTIGASIALVSQIYNIPGNISTFILAWVLLSLPLVYLMRSSITSVFYIIGITYFNCEKNYWGHYGTDSYIYWLLLLLVLPYYYSLVKNNPKSNFTYYHHWIVPISLIISLGTFGKKNEEWLMVGYMSLLSIFHLIGNISLFQDQKLRNNGYQVLGIVGILGLLLALSFNWFWKDLNRKEDSFSEITTSPEFLIAIVLTLLGGAFVLRQLKNQQREDFLLIDVVFLLFLIIFVVGFNAIILPVVFINLLVLSIGILTIRKGALLDHLGIMNFGLMLITALIVCRFFDTNLSFVLRGILFVAVGAGFFIANYLMIKNRRTHEG